MHNQLVIPPGRSRDFLQPEKHLTQHRASEHGKHRHHDIAYLNQPGHQPIHIGWHRPATQQVLSQCTCHPARDMNIIDLSCS